MPLNRGERRWTLPARNADWLVVSSVDAEAKEPHRHPVPEVFVTSALERWLSTPSARTLYGIYESLGGGSPFGLTGLERTRYEERLKQRLSDAFSRGELVALEVARPRSVPAPWTPQPENQDEEAVVEEMTWLAIELKDEAGKPVRNARYVVSLPDGSTREGTLNANGYARVEGVNPGECQVTFPELDGQSWS
ncbi:carboxypeptidase-like regulatory domain-containing protein [Myxococcus qinghaiensis]|uniref:carboxypeptidase-like regulatory domain-containing protein n=1 Tax=Myxococcus qinghaiensis TaxID=2906758 RepID=UPI0020A75BEB|nr:carboxypeptidase-like regulatory domain-containing protein [Myxococcus qinghaiensis]MCP3163442.1 carboxypeptidase-like regulatory domain-containing protein [Myxococcus qinghaiensis]